MRAQRRRCAVSAVAGLVAGSVLIAGGAPTQAAAGVGSGTGPGTRGTVAGLSWSLVRMPDCPPRSCWQVRVTAVTTACPHGLYLALNQWRQADLRSPTNTYLTDTTAVVPRVGRGQTVVVTLPRSARTAEGASLSEINCY